MSRTLLRAIAFAAAMAASAGHSAYAQETSVDPLEAQVDLRDAHRFAQVFADSDGAPDAAALQEGYLDGATRAIEIFTPGRIESADRLAAQVAADNAAYAQAIETCLPWIEGLQGELRATYLGFAGLLPEKPLPEIAVVFGAGNSGGTAGPGMQVLGLEVLCAMAPTLPEFQELMRAFFAHETVHTMQDISREARREDRFLTTAIAEGGADYVAMLVTGRMPDATRNAWALEREEQVFADFASDWAVTLDGERSDDERMEAAYRWFANAGNAPEGWPSELGYWVGMRIAEGYVENSPDRHAAIRELLAFDDPQAILERSGYAETLRASGE